MPQRLTLKLAGDAASVRIEITSSRRIDLAVRDAYAEFASQRPDLYLGWVGLAERLVRGDESGRERLAPDEIFGYCALAPGHGAPWDMVWFGVSVPGDIKGALGRRRYVDLAPSSDESRLLAALAQQQTVALRWVTEEVELIYRLGAESRETWLQALATNEQRTDEERHARYEQMLERGLARKSELPFYRRVTPRRPRRIAQPPATPIPFFAGRSGTVPRASRPTIAGLRFPAGMAAPDAVPAYWISDEPLEEAGSTAAAIADQFATTGIWPLVWLAEEDPAEYLDPPAEPDLVDALDAATVIRRAWERLASYNQAILAPFGTDFPGLAPAQRLYPSSVSDPFDLAGVLNVAARLMLVPCNRPADCFALIGGLATETTPAEISAVIRSWEERFGAVPVAAQPSGATLAINAPPSDETQALTLAAEHLAFSPPAEVGPGTLTQMADRLRDPGRPAAPDAGLLSKETWHIAWYD